MAVPLRDNERISSGSLLSALETADNRKSDWFQFPETEAMHLVASTRLVQMNENLENDIKSVVIVGEEGENCLIQSHDYKITN